MSWIEESIPWRILSLRYADTRKKQKELDNRVQIVPGSPERLPIRLPIQVSVQDLPVFGTDEFLMKQFFRENGRPVLSKFGKNVHLWILYFVTRGRIRADKNKNVYVFHGTPASEEDTVWLRTIMENNSNKFWVKCSDPFQILEDTTDRCNQLYEDILHKYENGAYCTKGDRFRCNQVNLRRLPEFVAYQSHRSHQHKNNVWSFIGVKLGGNQGRAETPKSVPHRIQSVHWYLQKYHKFLAPISRKVLTV